MSCYRGAVCTDEHAALPHAVHDLLRLRDRGLERRAIQHELDADEEAAAAHVADERVPARQTRQLAHQVAADLERIRLQSLAIQHVEHRESRGAGHGIAAEGIEVMRLSGERLRARRVMTAATGWPFPAAPSVTMSGVTP